MPDEFLTGSDWQSSSGPLVNRNVHEDDCWPHNGTVVGKDALFEGAHCALGIGAPGATQYLCPVGVLVSYTAASERCVLNMAPGFIFKAYVSNVTGYNAGVPNAWTANLNVGDPVYLDPSLDIGLGVNLSRSAADDAGNTNPRTGIVMPDQDEDEDVGIGGGNADVFPKAFEDGVSTHELLVSVMLWPDHY